MRKDEARGLARAAVLVDQGLRAAAAYNRPDLTEFLQRSRRKLADPAVQVVVVGEFKQGKSALVNALVGTAVCPVDDDIATAVPTYVRHGERPVVALLRSPRQPDPMPAVERRPVPFDQLRWHVLESEQVAEPSEPVTDGVVGAEVRVPCPLLEDGLMLVDTPGVGGIGSAHATASLAAASLADALVFVTAAAQELTQAELDFLQQARSLCDTVICVLTKVDLYPSWRQIAARTTEHLRRAEIDAPVLAVSSTLRAIAVASGDSELDVESGVPELIRVLQDTVGGDATERLAITAAADVVTVCDRITDQFRAERAALVEPEQAQQILAELTAVRERIQVLRSAVAKWNQTLNDGTADLVSDIDHDLRRRIRAVVVEAEEAIQESDPADTWPALRAWLRDRIAHEVLADYALLQRRAAELSELVGAHFREASGEILDEISIHDPAPLVDGQDMAGRFEPAKMKVSKQAVVAMRSAYGGAVMFVMLGMMAGVSIGPIGLGIALVMGHRGLREEKQRQLELRQREAGAAVRRYCDQVGFVMGKDSRDTLRLIQRQLRDHYTELAEQLDRSNTEALQRAGEVAGRTEAARKQRLTDLDAELGRIRQLRVRACDIDGRSDAGLLMARS
ncbi:dynamin family protein [Skermania piniformis]|uniref:Dynamin family protein n=1 Tax=Skermania pinensis TaxID=39122 RepID=A0ABX8S4T1_9ACTN|nr:dynamin family protein [Skermania piniformis]QXQ12848.1 dynamin family protein [Skermania piniformis]